MYDEGLAPKEKSPRMGVSRSTVGLASFYLPMIYIPSETMRAGMEKQNRTKRAETRVSPHLWSRIIGQSKPQCGISNERECVL